MTTPHGCLLTSQCQNIKGEKAVVIVMGMFWACSSGGEPGECIWCDGTGQNDCMFCDDGVDDCPMCVDGVNSRGDTCSYCNGEGETTCNQCNGVGHSTCNHCNGTGQR